MIICISRIILGDKSTKAEVFAGLLTQGAIKQNVEILFTGAREAGQLSYSQILTSRCE